MQTFDEARSPNGFARWGLRPLRSALAPAFALALAGCGVQGAYVWVNDLPPEQLAPVASPLKVGDQLSIFVRDQPTLSGEQTISADGTILAAMLGRIPAAGRTVAELSAELTKRYAPVIKQPAATVALVGRRPLSVSVVGEVRSAGPFELLPKAGVLDALASAGGPTEFADTGAVFVVRRGERPVRVRFDYDRLAAGDPVSNGFVLQDRDVIVVE